MNDFGKLADCMRFNIGNRRHRNCFQSHRQDHRHIHSCYRHIDCNMGYPLNRMNRIYNIENDGLAD